jgi:hypothetical protein
MWKQMENYICCVKLTDCDTDGLLQYKFLA